MLSINVVIIVKITGNQKPNEDNIISSLKICKLFLNDEVDSQIYKCIEDKINVNNVATLFNLSQLYHLSSLIKPSLCFIERCFSTIADSQIFLELNFVTVRKILSSSELNIDSELQVFNAAYSWLSHIKERSKYEKVLLMKIRLPLLSDSALDFIIRKNSCFTISSECVGIIRNVLEKKKGLYFNKFSNISRYCSQENFNVVTCGGHDRNANRLVNNVYRMNKKNSVTILPPMKERRQYLKTVCIKNELYVFGGVTYGGNTVLSVEKYSIATNTWRIIAKMYDDRKHFCLSSFMNNVYVIGGITADHISNTNSCIKFNTKDNKWRTVAGMNEARLDPPCAVFEGRIVVCGGYGGYRNGDLKTVEAYDHIADKWSNMPNMIERRENHKSVAIKNKLFVVGGLNTPTFEVFDSTCNKFVLLKPLNQYNRHLKTLVEVVLIGTRLVLYSEDKNTVLFYDVKNEVWSPNKLKIKTNLSSSLSYTKVPQT